MEEVAGVIDALVAEYRRRAAQRRPGQPAPAFSVVVRDVLKARFTAAPAPPPARTAGRIRPPAQPPGQSAAGVAASVAAPTGTPTQPAATRPSGQPGAPPPAPREGRLVTALFANPQNLVAAFIVAEILAPPVALRPLDHQRSALQR